MQKHLIQHEAERRTTTLISEQRDLRLPIIHPNPFLTNKICTSKYTLLTFIPKNMLYQFKKLANLYFLAISVLQAIPIISVSDGIPNMLFPLTVVIIFSAIKDLLEDLKRKQSDKDENNCFTRKRSFGD